MIIPKRLHRIWLGGQQSPEFETWGSRWRELHPDWEFREWDARALESFPAIDRAVWTTCCRDSQRSNILRLHILYEMGGVYIDHDIEPLANIESVLDTCPAAITPFWVQRQEHPRCNNSFLAAVPKHKWMRDCIELLKSKDPAVYLSMGSALVTQALAENPDVRILEPWLILQNPAWTVLKTLRQPDPRTVAIHHFASRWAPNPPAVPGV